MYVHINGNKCHKNTVAMVIAMYDKGLELEVLANANRVTIHTALDMVYESKRRK